MPPVNAQAGQLRDGLHYAVHHPDILWPTVLASVFGMFTSNLPVTLAAYARSVFHSGPGGYGLLSAIVAVGAVTGALVSARRSRICLRTLIAVGSVLAAIEMLSAAAPGQGIYCVFLLPIGACTLLLLTTTNSTVQTAAPDAIRAGHGRYLLVPSVRLGRPGAGPASISARDGMLLAGAVGTDPPRPHRRLRQRRLLHHTPAARLTARIRPAMPRSYGRDGEFAGQVKAGERSFR